MRRVFGVLVTAALLVVVWASAAMAQSDYPPPTPTAGPGQAGRVPGAAAGQLPTTGSSNTPSLILIGIAALVVGLVLILAVRRHRVAVRGNV